MKAATGYVGILLLGVGCSDYGINPQENEVLPPIDSGARELDPVDPELPVAVCAVDPEVVHPPFESANFDGRDSYDPTGGTIEEYQWTLISKPAGSALEIDSQNPQVRDVQPDLSGDYVVELVVTNDQGIESEPCEVTLSSEPTQSLWIEMFWSRPNDDMDLHLLAPNGNLRTNKDCYYQNCVGGLEWGAAGAQDNPRLDLDDIPGTGPENINIDEPQSATYTVYVNDYPGSPMQQANDVTVNIYVDGEKLYSETKTISGENDDVKFATVNWATGEITAY